MNVAPPNKAEPRTASPLLRYVFSVAEQKGYTDEALAAMGECSRYSISAWRRGTMEPRIMVVERLMAGLGITYGKFT